MEKAIPHRHCIICGKVVGSNELFCSDACEKRYKGTRRVQRIFLIGLIAIFAFMLIMMYT